MAFAAEIVEPELFAEAWKDFNDQKAVKDFEPESPMNALFVPWFLFNWVLDLKPPGSDRFSETTVAEMFLLLEFENLTHPEQLFLRSSIRCPFTLCEVVEVKPGVGMTLFDLLRRARYEVAERTASQTLKRGAIIYCATAEIAGLKSNVGTGPYALDPTAKRDVLELRKWIVDQIGDGDITPAHLHEFEFDIRGLYLDLVTAMFTPPTLVNTDGDPMLPQKLHFQIESSDAAFRALNRWPRVAVRTS